MPKPDYLTPQRAGELLPTGKVHSALLCPHCNHVLYVGEKSPPIGGRPKHRKPSVKGASRSSRPR